MNQRIQSCESLNAAAFSMSEFGIELDYENDMKNTNAICQYFSDVLGNDSSYEEFTQKVKVWKSYEGYTLTENKRRIDHFKQALKLFAESSTNEDRRGWLALMYVNALCHVGYKIICESTKRRHIDI